MGQPSERAMMEATVQRLAGVVEALNPILSSRGIEFLAVHEDGDEYVVVYTTVRQLENRLRSLARELVGGSGVDERPLVRE